MCTWVANYSGVILVICFRLQYLYIYIGHLWPTTPTKYVTTSFYISLGSEKVGEIRKVTELVVGEPVTSMTRKPELVKKTVIVFISSKLIQYSLRLTKLVFDRCVANSKCYLNYWNLSKFPRGAACISVCHILLIWKLFRSKSVGISDPLDNVCFSFPTLNVKSSYSTKWCVTSQLHNYRPPKKLRNRYWVVLF